MRLCALAEVFGGTMHFRKTPVCRIATLLAFTVAGSPATAERLQDVLRQALRTSPVLAAASADTAAIGEGVAQAKANGRPRATVAASETEFAKQAIRSTFLPDRTLRSDLSIIVPLYRSGAVKYAVKDAAARYDGARENLRATIANLFNGVVASYSDVIRDEAIVLASERNVAALQTNLRAVRGRYSIGDMTTTDVALSEARLSLAEGNLQEARAQLIDSREEFVRLVGSPPSNLTEIENVAGVPNSVELAVQEAIDQNGTLRAARKDIDAASFRILSAQGERGMRVSAFSAGSYFNNLHSIDSRSIFAARNDGTAAQVGVGLELPLYQGGQPASRVRQARNEQSSAIEQAVALERDIVARTRSAYANQASAEGYLTKAQAAVVANERALKAARMENAVGTRSLLDVLDTERELFNNRVSVAMARRELNVSSFTLLALTGRADPEDLGLADALDRRVVPPAEPRAAWSDWADGRSRYVSGSVSTASLPAQDGRVRR